MLIVCPACASEYTIDVDRIGPNGRVVRCASCREAWFIGPEEVLQAQGGGSAEAKSERSRPSTPATSRDRAGPTGDRAAVMLSLALLAVMGLAIAFRTTCVRIAPESAALFAMIGLPVNLVGLQLADIKSDVGQEGEAQVLVVSGEIANQTGGTVQVPPLAFAIEGEKGATLYSWTERKAGGELAPHAVRHFQARLASPPPEGRQVLVTFSTKAGAATVASR